MVFRLEITVIVHLGWVDIFVILLKNGSSTEPR